VNDKIEQGGNNMGQRKGISILLAIGVIAILSVSVSLAEVKDSKTEGERNSASVIRPGKPGPGAIEIVASFVRPEFGFYRPGDKATLTIQPEKDAHILGVYYGPGGDAMVFFPNLERKDALIKGGKAVTLFGEESSLKLNMSKKTRGAKIAFYASSSPFSIEPWQFTRKEPFIVISKDDKENMDRLKEIVESMSKDEGFNIVTLDFPRFIKPKLKGKPKGAPMELMGPPPSPSESSKPTGVSGVAGQSEEEVKPTKE
jgi:hypothetical protein